MSDDTMTEDSREHILCVDPEDLAVWFQEQGEPSYRLDQVLNWVYDKRVTSFEEMTSLSKELREKLDSTFRIGGTNVINELRSERTTTEKLVIQLPDGAQIESVRMEDEGRPSFCISSQVGCQVGCRFCATGQMGFVRDLEAWEILGQVVELAKRQDGLGNVVFMGMGEPLLNLDNVLEALDSLTDPCRFGLGTRRITVSTVGIPEGIRRLAHATARPRLALSLNSPLEQERDELMPYTRRFELRDVLEACREYRDRTGRRISLEYVLIAGVNTGTPRAQRLVQIAKNLEARVNLIALNPVQGIGYESPEREEVEEFREVLEDENVRVTQRYKRGRDIAAGCGQLATKKSEMGEGE
ncbi:MAG: 23S rRNA (adenine(2503)-C(2))-methyltransferase RlmN [Planctomycetes bacterium]|nr:23S rRNA (adenine(2503)-C(2))-methyltransferase RlmN [Planctomycetota bacterium]